MSIAPSEFYVLICDHTCLIKLLGSNRGCKGKVMRKAASRGGAETGERMEKSAKRRDEAGAVRGSCRSSGKPSRIAFYAELRRL